MPRVGRSMMTVNVYVAESTGVVSATALGNGVQYFIPVMGDMKSYQRFIIELLIAFFKTVERYWEITFSHGAFLFVSNYF